MLSAAFVMAVLAAPPASAEFGDVTVQAIAVRTASATDTTTDPLTLPNRVACLQAGTEFALEFWISDTGTVNTGIIGMYVDVTCDPAVVSALEATHSPLFALLPSGTIESASGTVTNFGGSDGTFQGQGVWPSWARLGWIDYVVIADGMLTYSAHVGLGGVGVRGRIPPSPDEVLFVAFDVANCSCRSDLDGDALVSLQDLAILLAHFGLTNGQTPADGDIDRDADVDLQDLAFLLASFGEAC